MKINLVFTLIFISFRCRETPHMCQRCCYQHTVESCLYYIWLQDVWYLSSYVTVHVMCSLRGQAVLCGSQERGEEGGGHRGREEEADFSRLPLQRHRSSPGSEEDGPQDPEQVLLAGDHPGRGGLGTQSSAPIWTFIISLSDPECDCLPFQIKVCETCQHAERNKNLARIVRPLKVEAPWEIVGIDVLGSFICWFVCSCCVCVPSPRPSVCLYIVFTRTVPRDQARQHQRHSPHRLLHQVARSFSSAEDGHTLSCHVHFQMHIQVQTTLWITTQFMQSALLVEHTN